MQPPAIIAAVLGVVMALSSNYGGGRLISHVTP